MYLKPKLLAGLGGLLLIVACESSDSDSPAGLNFGRAFQAMFDADPNDEPVDAQSIDIAVDLTADPFNP